MHNPFHPPPAPPAFAEGKVLPERNASILSRLVFRWLAPFLDVGFSRPLQLEDLWELPPDILTANLTSVVETNFYARCPPEKRPQGDTHSDLEEERTLDDKAQTEKQQYDSSLLKSLHHTYFTSFWLAGFMKLFADTLKTTTPLINKLLLSWLSAAYLYHHTGEGGSPQGIGYGIGLGFALFAMQEFSSLLTNHYSMEIMKTGLSLRTSLTGAIFRKSLRLSGRSRMKHSVGQITTMISTDTNRLDRVVYFVHNLWVAPIQIVIGIALLIVNLGYSALVGLGVLIFAFPIQYVLVKVMFDQRKKGVKITDQRVRLTTEVLQGVRLIKLYAWESFYAYQIATLRKREIRAIEKRAWARSGLIANVTFVPVLAAILSFITYGLSGHDLNVAIIFSSLQYFNIIRAPLQLFPLVLGALTDAGVALDRISTFLTAEELKDRYLIERGNDWGVEVEGDFVWEGAGPQSGGEKGRKGKFVESGEKETLPTSDVMDEKEKLREGEEEPFKLRDLRLRIPRGSFVAIIGRVGSGKSSLLQAVIGEMRRTRGDVKLGGSVAYVPQSAWIRNATLRENVLFGQDDDEKKFRDIIRACSLEHDLEMLPQGEYTEIGEKGINLSGGQKARVSLARAAYSGSDMILMDDSLSAVDAYVGKAILDNCILSGPLSSKTRVLVTHALHVLDKTDYIYVLDEGVIKEEGTYSELMKDSVVFSRLMEEYGNLEQEKQEEPIQPKDAELPGAAMHQKGTKTELMSKEERALGAVSWSVYSKYLKFAGGLVWFPIILLLLILAQGSQVGNNLFLGFWTATSIPGFREGDYIAVYAALGVASAVFSFTLSMAFAYGNLAASLTMFDAALKGVLHSPTSFFDTTPMGRIFSRFSKDQDTIDAQLSTTLDQFLTQFSSVVGTIALVFYAFPYLGIIFVPLTALYWIVSTYYRRSSVETKRLDSLMRSILYGSIAETLTGLATVRAYRVQPQSISSADHGLDLENRAYYMTIAIQRWLGVRLDFFGNILILGIALFAAGFRNTVDPSKIGVVLSYTLSITQVFSDMVSQFAQNEQNMNAVERMLIYTELPSEGATHTPNDPPASWPEKGAIRFTDAELAYRQGLPLVLKGISLDIKPGEKVGVVGRTGAGKSSLIQALFRIVELQHGSIEIDGINIRDIGLDALRTRLALVPQDSTLFLGTLRDNLDPQGTRTDAELISALQRAWLLPREGVSDPAAEAKFSLFSTVSDEGSNFSAGEKQLLALCRALVKNSRIIVLDEATSNVDVETDSKLQKTIQIEFSSSTLLCIAHRLNTIAYYDRVLVMDAGRVAEFDTVLNLFDREDSIFRSLCNEAGLSRPDILRIRQEAGAKE